MVNTAGPRAVCREGLGSVPEGTLPPPGLPLVCFNPAGGGLSSSGTFLLGSAGPPHPPLPSSLGRGLGCGDLPSGLFLPPPGSGQGSGSWAVLAACGQVLIPAEADRERSPLVVRKTPSDREPQRLEAVSRDQARAGLAPAWPEGLLGAAVPPGARVGLVAAVSRPMAGSLSA